MFGFRVFNAPLSSAEIWPCRDGSFNGMQNIGKHDAGERIKRIHEDA